MTIISAIPGAGDAFAELVQGLQSEFGCTDVCAMAARILESEKADFHWQARVAEHYLGHHFAVDCCDSDGDPDCSRIAILSFVAERWHAGVCLVGGDGEAVELLSSRSFERREDAVDTFRRAR